jgi:sugar phosphate isomerase/epimerase
VRTLTLGYLSLADVGPLDMIEAAADAGFRSVGVRLTARRPVEPWEHASVTDRTAMRRLSDMLTDRGVALSNVSTFHLYPEVTLEHLKPVIEVCAGLRAKTLIGCLYRQPDDAAIDFLVEYAAYAGAAGLRIALETVSYSACSTLSLAREVLRKVGSPVLGLMLDPLHLQRGGSDWTTVREIAASDICIAQLCDAIARPGDGVDAAIEARTLRRYPGDGELPLAAFLHSLPESAEIEIEVPAREHRHLPPKERAMIMRTRCVDYLRAQGVSTN